MNMAIKQAPLPVSSLDKTGRHFASDLILPGAALNVSRNVILNKNRYLL